LRSNKIASGPGGFEFEQGSGYLGVALIH
jgi:hypothetical protein